MNRYFGELQTDVYGFNLDNAKIAHLVLTKEQACASDADGIHAVIAGKTTAQTITTDIVNPPYPRNITLDIGGTAGDVKAGDIVVNGTNFNNEPISETFTLINETDTDQIGTKAFKTITSITVPAQDGTGATFTFGFGEKLGLPYMLDSKPLVFALQEGVLETTAPTLAIDSDELEKNTVDLNSNLDSTKGVDIYLVL